MIVNLPYLTCIKKQQRSKSHVPEAIWSSVDVDLQEYDINELQTALIQFHYGNRLQKTYAVKDKLWEDATCTFMRDDRLHESLTPKEKLHYKQEREWNELRSISYRLYHKNIVKLYKQSNRSIDVLTCHIKSKEEKISVNDDLFRNHFVKWAKSNLISAGGNILKRVSKPSKYIGWAGSGTSLTYFPKISGSIQCPSLFGSNEFTAGIHFGFDQEQELGDTKVLVDATKFERMPEYNSERFIDAIQKIQNNPYEELPEGMSFVENYLVNSDLLNTISEEGDEIAYRSTLAVARNLVQHARPKSLKSTEKREIYMALEKNLLELSLSQVEWHQMNEKIASLLEQLVPRVNVGQQFFIKRALERYNDHTISIGSQASNFMI